MALPRSGRLPFGPDRRPCEQLSGASMSGVIFAPHVTQACGVFLTFDVCRRLRRLNKNRGATRWH
ncbi:hypothetical protein CBM2613_B170269 [Cupriavidus taiwanensis]|uniref:Uncharacterized protein n=1 Tax=Cupriavidus taiwanensis TaxID=164546 RepID=A0A375E8V6_9BURK|nr:hypothetical protein CBM2613_B170269 [Cupriavidus taiwanensis]